MGLRSLLPRVVRGLERGLVEPLRLRRRARTHAAVDFEPVFVTGAMGSGTTLLSLELSQRFETSGVIDESCLVAARNTHLHVEPIGTHARICDYEATLGAGPAWESGVIWRECQQIYRERVEHVSGPVIDKAANAHLYRMDVLGRAFPGAPLVAIFRDPAANIEGFRRKWPTFGRDSLQECCRFWQALYERFLAERDAWPGPSLLLGYEALIGDPEATFAKVGGALGLQHRRRGPDLQPKANVPGQGVRNVEAGGIRIVKDANDSALAGLTTKDIEVIRKSLGDLHERLRKSAANS